MMNMFSFIFQSGNGKDNASFFDWLFSDKFDRSIWSNPNRIQAMAKRIKKFNRLRQEDFKCDALKRMTLPKAGTFKSNRCPTILFGEGDGEARGWIRHIRNGIAHGNCHAVLINGEPCLELLDFSDDSHKNQTAYILIPLEYMFETKRIYDELEAKWKKTDSKEKKMKRRKPAENKRAS